MKTEGKHMHRLVKINYLPRIFTALVAILILYAVRNAVDRQNPFFSPYILLLALWPHIAFFSARAASNQKKAEDINVSIDSFFIGTSMPAAFFDFWLCFGALNVILANSIRMGGVKRLLRESVILSTGVFAGMIFFGYDPVTESSRLAMFISLLCLSTYFVILSFSGRSILNQLVESNRKLETARKNSEAANIAKSEFLANMSHEIRTPMNCISGMTYFIQKTELNQEQKEYVQHIRTSSELLLSIISNILDLSKIEAGRISFDNKPFEIRSIIRTLEIMMSMKFKEKDLSFECSTEDIVPEWIVGDPVRLEQVLLNLCSNAEKFTHKGRVDVHVSLIKENEKSVQLKFEVKDTGIGVPQDKSDLLFKKFSQIDTSSTRKYSGAGLGLSISKKLVELMGGNIGVISNVNEGSLFWFTVWFDKSEKVEKNDKPESTLESQHNYEIKKEIIPENSVKLVLPSVLVAEDNELNQLVITNILTRSGCNCEVVGNGREAVEALRRKHFDLVLMDIQMPEMDGIQATKAIRSGIDLKNDIPIIAVTAKAMTEDRESCLEAGMDGYITKPVNPGHLIETIKGFLPGFPGISLEKS